MPGRNASRPPHTIDPRPFRTAGAEDASNEGTSWTRAAGAGSRGPARTGRPSPTQGPRPRPPIPRPPTRTRTETGRPPRTPPALPHRAPAHPDPTGASTALTAPRPTTDPPRRPHRSPRRWQPRPGTAHGRRHGRGRRPPGDRCWAGGEWASVGTAVGRQPRLFATRGRRHVRGRRSPGGRRCARGKSSPVRRPRTRPGGRRAGRRGRERGS